VRAHGALYNAAATDTEHARALVDAAVQYDKELPLPGRHGGVAAGGGGRPAAGLGGVSRPRLHGAGLLQPRTEPDALLTDADEAAVRAVRMVTEGLVTAVDGTEVELRAEALTLHSDTAGAVEIARRTREALEAAGVALVPV
jgi:UPF0271 protein